MDKTWSNLVRRRRGAIRERDRSSKRGLSNLKSKARIRGGEEDNFYNPASNR